MSGTICQRIKAHLSVSLTNLCLWFQAKEFQVAGMHPSAQSIILGGQWSSQARNCFITLVKDRSLLVSLYSIQHGIMRVQVLINTETKNTSVVDILVQKGHAVKADEGLDSKVRQQLGAQLVKITWNQPRHLNMLFLCHHTYPLQALELHH